MISFSIPINPVTKKNHGQIVTLKNGRRLLLPSKQYQDFAKLAKSFLPSLDAPIDFPINLECHYFMKTRRKCDLVNLLQATCDILVDNNIILDDNYSIIASIDGSFVSYDKDNPRTDIFITKKD